jgi:hypothetical protein
MKNIFPRIIHNHIKIFFIIFLFPLLISAQLIGKRTSFNIPLVKLSLSENAQSPDFKKIRITTGGSEDYAIITRLSDFFINNTRQGIEKTTYAERLHSMYTLTDFEAKQINITLKSLISTLEIFERDLHKERWDKCLFLDSYFPRFMKGFYFLSCTAFNDREALPKGAQVFDSMFDVSLKSPKSDERINNWRNKNDQIIKLRIAARELIFQLKKWQKNELTKSKRKADIMYSKNLKEAYSLFVKMYFCL